MFKIYNVLEWESTRGIQQLSVQRLILATGQHWNIHILVTRSSMMWNMMVKIPECFVHLDASYVHQIMDLMNDKPSDCKMCGIIKFFTTKGSSLTYTPSILPRLCPLWLSSVSSIERPPKGQALLVGSWTRHRNFIVILKNRPIALPSRNRKTDLTL